MYQSSSSAETSTGSVSCSPNNSLSSLKPPVGGLTFWGGPALTIQYVTFINTGVAGGLSGLVPAAGMSSGYDSMVSYFGFLHSSPVACLKRVYVLRWYICFELLFHAFEICA